MSGTLLCSVVGLLATVASAQPTPDALGRLLERMDAPTLAEREAAEQELLAIPSLTLERIETIAQRDGLSPEQSMRLRKAARKLFDRRPLPGMGIQFQGSSTEGVPIGDTIAGFAAHDVLQPLDTVTSCNGRRMRSQEDLQAAILSSDPGDDLVLEIVRDGAAQTVTVRLGSFDDLPNAQRPSPLMMYNAFTLRWGLSVDAPAERIPPIGAGITLEQWAAVEAGDADGGSPQWPLTREAASRMVSFGGLPRSALAVRHALADPAAPIDPIDLARGEVSNITSIVDRMRALSRQRILVDQRARTLETHADMVTDATRREQLLDQRNAALQERTAIENELAALREALRSIRDGE